MRLVRAELRKILTTSTWWVFGLIMLPLWAASTAVNWANAAQAQNPPPDVPAAQAEQIRVAGESVNIATTLYTSGQFFGVLLVMLLGAIVVTNEFFHQTATTTFLVTPVRHRVVLGKLAASVLIGLVFWLVTTMLNLIVVPLIMHQLHLGNLLDNAAVWRAIGLNALAFGVWAVLGVGLGVLIRSQLAATLTLSIAYLVGNLGATLVFFLLSTYVASWLSKLQVIVPTAASQLMIAGTELPGNPPRWVGAAVLIGYAVVAGGIGTAIMRRRDIT